MGRRPAAPWASAGRVLARSTPAAGAPAQRAARAAAAEEARGGSGAAGWAPAELPRSVSHLPDRARALTPRRRRERSRQAGRVVLPQRRGGEPSSAASRACPSVGASVLLHRPVRAISQVSGPQGWTNEQQAFKALQQLPSTAASSYTVARYPSPAISKSPVRGLLTIANRSHGLPHERPSDASAQPARRPTSRCSPASSSAAKPRVARTAGASSTTPSVTARRWTASPARDRGALTDEGRCPKPRW